MKKLVPIVALVAMLSLAQSVRAAAIALSYVSGSISSTSNFATGTTTTVNLTGGSPSVTMSSGQFFRFGVAVQVTGNSNGVDSGWNTTAQRPVATGDDQVDVPPFGYGNPSMPANLGLATIGMKIPSSDTNASLLIPRIANTPLVSRSVAALGPAGSSWSVRDQGKIDSPGGTGSSASSGSVGVDALGNPISSLFEGQGAANVQDPTFVPKLGYFSTTGNLFTGLTYAANANGVVTLSPALDAALVSFWKNQDSLGNPAPGSVDGNGNIVTDPKYSAVAPTGGDALGTLAAINITIGAVPEPASMGLIGLAMTSLLARRRKIA